MPDLGRSHHASDPISAADRQGRAFPGRGRSQGRGLGPRWRKVGRDLWLHKGRTFLVVLAIATGIFGAGTVLDTWALLARVTRQQFLGGHPAAATLHLATPAPAGAALALALARVRGVPGVVDAQARSTVAASAQAGGGAWQGAELFAIDEREAVRIGAVQPVAGTWPPPDGTVVVERSSLALPALAPLGDVTVGATLRLRAGDRPPVELPVAGVVRDSGLPPGWMDHVVYGFVSRRTLARLGLPPVLDQVRLTVAPHWVASGDRAAIRRIAFAAKQAIESGSGAAGAGGGPRVESVDVPEPGRHPHAAQMDSLLFIQEAFGLLTLLLSGLLVVNLVSAMLAGQVREVGVMKAVGGRPRQIAALYLGMALALGLLACTLAVPAAALAGRAYARFAGGMLNFDLAAAALPPGVILLQLAVGALLPVAAAAVPVLLACRVTVGAALRDQGVAAAGQGGNPAGGGGWRERLAGRRSTGSGRGRWARPLSLALRNVLRRRQRTALTLATLACGGAVYLASINLRAAIAGSVDALFAAEHFDLTVSLARPHAVRDLETLAAAVPGVRRAEAWSAARAVTRWSDGTLGNAFQIAGPPVPSPVFVPAPEQGRWLRPGDGRVLVVSRRLATEQPGLALGREVELLIGGRRAAWRVVGVVEAGPFLGAYAERQTLAATASEAQGRFLAVAATTPGRAAQDDLLGRLDAALDGAGMEVRSRTLLSDQRRSVEDHLLMVGGFLGVMGQLLILVGGLGLASTMSLAMLERTREIGVLRAIGARHSAIFAMVQIEALAIALASWAAAIPLSLAASVLLGDAFGRIMFRVPVHLLPQPAGVMRWAVVAVVVAVVAAAWPARRAMRIPTAAALAYE